MLCNPRASGNNHEEREFIQDGMHPEKYEFAISQLLKKFAQPGAYETVDGFGASGWVVYMESHDEQDGLCKNKYGATSVKASFEINGKPCNECSMLLGVLSEDDLAMGERIDYNKCVPEGVDKQNHDEKRRGNQ